MNISPSLVSLLSLLCVQFLQKTTLCNLTLPSGCRKSTLSPGMNKVKPTFAAPRSCTRADGGMSLSPDVPDLHARQKLVEQRRRPEESLHTASRHGCPRSSVSPRLPDGGRQRLPARVEEDGNAARGASRGETPVDARVHSPPRRPIHPDHRGAVGCDKIVQTLANSCQTRDSRRQDSA
jgi:hypothetical protein